MLDHLMMVPPAVAYLVIGLLTFAEAAAFIGLSCRARPPSSGGALRIDAARAVLRRRGGSAVLLGRFAAFLRAVKPALAALSRMPYRTFLLYNALGPLVWGTGATLLGYFAGASYQRVAQTVGRGSAGLLVLLVLVGNRGLASTTGPRGRSRE